MSDLWDTIEPRTMRAGSVLVEVMPPRRWASGSLYGTRSLRESLRLRDPDLIAYHKRLRALVRWEMRRFAAFNFGMRSKPITDDMRQMCDDLGISHD